MAVCREEFTRMSFQATATLMYDLNAVFACGNMILNLACVY